MTTHIFRPARVLHHAIFKFSCNVCTTLHHLRRLLLLVNLAFILLLVLVVIGAAAGASAPPCLSLLAVIEAKVVVRGDLLPRQVLHRRGRAPRTGTVPLQGGMLTCGSAHHRRRISL